MHPKYVWSSSSVEPVEMSAENPSVVSREHFVEATVYLVVDKKDDLLIFPPCNLKESTRLGYAPFKTAQRCLTRQYELEADGLEFLRPVEFADAKGEKNQFVAVCRAIKLSGEALGAAVRFAHAETVVSDGAVVSALRKQLEPWVVTSGKDPVKCFGRPPAQ